MVTDDVRIWPPPAKATIRTPRSANSCRSTGRSVRFSTASHTAKSLPSSCSAHVLDGEGDEGVGGAVPTGLALHLSHVLVQPGEGGRDPAKSLGRQFLSRLYVPSEFW